MEAGAWLLSLAGTVPGVSSAEGQKGKEGEYETKTDRQTHRLHTRLPAPASESRTSSVSSGRKIICLCL